MFSKKGFRLPAEWEPQSGVQLTWPHLQTDWAYMLEEIVETYQQMAREIEKHEPLLVVAPAGTEVGRDYFACPTDDTWARDHGFLTLTNTPVPGQEGVPSACQHASSTHPQDGVGEALLLDFCFNGWGRKYPAGKDNAINRRLYDAGLLAGEYVDSLDFVLEGGSIESDGRGTIFTTTACLMAQNRNQPLSQAEIEARLKAYLCAERIVWIDHGQLTGDDTDGHIDTLLRSCPADTLLYVGCHDVADEQYAGLQAMKAQLQGLRTIEGGPYRLLELPMPRPIYEDGERLPATYANFLVVNGAVLCPTYDQPELDEEALATISQAFPDREMVPIDCRSIVRQHGSLHCCTMQFPAGVLEPQKEKR